jgi:hypothetical protein
LTPDDEWRHDRLAPPLPPATAGESLVGFGEERETGFSPVLGTAVVGVPRRGGRPVAGPSRSLVSLSGEVVGACPV